LNKGPCAGPMKTTPASWSARENSEFSDRKPTARGGGWSIRLPSTTVGRSVGRSGGRAVGRSVGMGALRTQPSKALVEGLDGNVSGTVPRPESRGDGSQGFDANEARALSGRVIGEF